MDIYNFVGGVVGGVIGSSAIAAFVGKFALTTVKERWLEGVRAESAQALEKVKDSMEREQKTLQARLDFGTYANQAQYDLEFSSYKDIWVAMGELRERWRGLFFQSQIHFKDDETKLAALTQAGTEVGVAHDKAVLVSERLALYCEKDIHTAARAATYASMVLMFSLQAQNEAQTVMSSEERDAQLTAIIERVDQIETLIRERQKSVRLL